MLKLSPAILQKMSEQQIRKDQTDLATFIQKKVGNHRNILITGASSGLGAGMARFFADMGYNLALCARRTDRLETLKAEILAKYPHLKISVKALDVLDYDAVFQVFHEFKQEFGKLDRIIVNAGIGEGRSIGKGNFAINRRTLEVNLVSGLAQCEAGMEIFREQNQGHLVIVSSMSAMRGMPGYMATYAASKAGIAHLAEGLRAEMLLSKKPIKISTIYPGYIRTEINEGAKPLLFEVSEEVGTQAMAVAIEHQLDEVHVPALPWKMVGKFMHNAPLELVVKLFK